ncbi:MAG: excinuclease ABC subunit UvrA [Candidatus Latescibacterota bacterium]|nr:excinuclease ABC subunit UvrA [Candidatus Latescibacterota bacterium]
MESGSIFVRGARVHNLKNIDLELPKNRLICFTGVSGSGKSSMAFDTLYAEGQRRYVASLSAYARQFLGQLEKPDVDQIHGLAPTISISQKSGGANPRSTVGTITEVYDYLRVLFARCGTPHCTECGLEIGAQTRDQIVGRIAAMPANSKIHILAPVVQARRGEYQDLFEELHRDGYLRVRADGQLFTLDKPPELDRYSRHSIEVVVDRLTLRGDFGFRLEEAVDNALRLGEGSLIITEENGESDWLLSANFDCPKCSISFDEPTPQMFSFNNPQGMCPDCGGLGTRVIMSEKLMVSDPSLSVFEGAVEPLGDIVSNRWRHHLYEGAAEHLGFTLDTPWQDLTDEQKDGFLNGLGDRKIEFTYTNKSGHSWAHDERYEGALKYVEERLHNGNAKIKKGLSKYVRTEHCGTCDGRRLRREALSVLVAGESLPRLAALPIEESCRFFHELQFDEQKTLIAEDALKEIRGRLDLLDGVGLGYLTLDRGAHTLSSGESQRIRLASQIGSGLVGVLYILDEPSIGLHHRDNQRLLDTLKRLRDAGNTVVVVEHDEDTMRQADLVVDFGPGAGDRGGHLVISGDPATVTETASSVTGRYLAGSESISVPERRRPASDRWLTVKGARHNNLRDIDVHIPVGILTCVTGVSGSGKSSLINDILFKSLDITLHRAQLESGDHDSIEGTTHLDKVIRIDQRPIGRTPRSNPATYTDVFTPIRQLFTQLPESKVRGYKQGRFSFNVRGGRCDACDGNGANLVEMEFLADMWVTCEVCQGERFNRETLSIRYRDHSIADVLEMEVDDALKLFANVPHIRIVLQTLHDVGLGYIKLGQPAPTLSGGEAQRVKLAKELCRSSTGRTLYLLDEPTTGLHFADIDKLLNILQRLTDTGNTVVIIEHNTDVIKTADWIVDMGPEGGAEGGLVVVEGPPEKVAAESCSHTGRALKSVLATRRTAGKSAKNKPGRKDDGLIREIEVVGANMHNLRNVDVRIPRDQITVVSGVSGSGKSTLAFDTIYAEGQRRYVESLSAYARQFLDQMQKPKVERITGLSPAIAIEQKAPSRNPRSTAGTVTEVYDYIRALYATVGTQFCPRCNVPAGAQTPQQMVDRILAMPEGRRILVLSPMEPLRNEGYETLLRHARHDGYARVRINSELHSLDEEIELDRRLRHRVELVVDRLVVRKRDRSRLNEAVEKAVDLSRGEVFIASPDDNDEVRYSRRYSCPSCGRGFASLVPQSFSFNHHNGMCPVCDGLGTGEGVDRDMLLPDFRSSLSQGAVSLWGKVEARSPLGKALTAVGKELGFDLRTPLAEFSDDGLRGLLYGAGDRTVELADEGARLSFGGVLPTVDRMARQVPRYKNLLRQVDCSACEGSRLKPESRAVRLRDTTVVELQRWPISQCFAFFESLELNESEAEVAGELLVEVRNRLSFLDRVGLGYVSLDRRSGTLSGGEAQRIRLAGQIGSGLTGVLYLLDEPTIGLHPRDTRRLLEALETLRNLGNTVVVVEHDRDTLEAADHIVDLGPGAGTEGGRVVASGPPNRLSANGRKGSHRRKPTSSRTADYLQGDLSIGVPARRRKGTGKRLRIRGARQNNLKNVDVEFPLGTFTCVTGVSGSGKSSLVEEILHTGLAAELQGSACSRGECDDIEGVEHLDKVINVDQTPIGHSPRSTPATVMGVFDQIRQLYAKIPEARVRGFTAGRFSFNRTGGRCESCEGLGHRCIEMHFLPDVWVRCDACGGKRYSNEILAIKFKGHSICDVLDMRVSQALNLFANVGAIHSKLAIMDDVGLSYMALGQSSTTLSGGEAQRLKLAAELARPGTGRTVYIMDEPTTGLHFADIQNLLAVMQRLVEGGNTLILVEHNLDVIKTADHLIDIGPEGGEAGGQVVGTGTPEQLARHKGSHTGRFLKNLMKSTSKSKAKSAANAAPRHKRA